MIRVGVLFLCVYTCVCVCVCAIYVCVSVRVRACVACVYVLNGASRFISPCHVGDCSGLYNSMFASLYVSCVCVSCMHVAGCACVCVCVRAPVDMPKHVAISRGRPSKLIKTGFRSNNFLLCCAGKHTKKTIITHGLVLVSSN